jgi:surface-anchored protein
MSAHRFAATGLAALLVLATFANAARAQLYLSSGHVDLNVGHTLAPGPGFGLYAHHVSALAGGATVDEPVDHSVFFVPDTGGRYATAGGLLPFLGQSGQPVWLIPQNSPPTTVPWVGFGGYGLAGAEGAPSTDLDAFDPLPGLTGSATVPAVRVRYLGALTPVGADFALWQTGSGGAINLFFSNRPGTTAPQVFGLRRGQHIHFNWGFSQPGYYRVRLRLEGEIGGVPVAPRDFGVDFAISVLPLYEQWRRAGDRFTAAERANRGIGGPLADPDGDGRANLLEYAFSTEPRLADSAAGAPLLTLSGATPTLNFSRLADPLLAYRVESSANLSEWSAFWSSTSGQNLVGPVSVPAITPLSPASPRAFLRLRVNHIE